MSILHTILQAAIPVLFWHGIPAGDAETLMPMLAQTGADMYLCRYADLPTCLQVLDAAQANGIRMYISYNGFNDNPEEAMEVLRSHPAFEGYYLKDEPETWDIDGLGQLVDRIHSSDAVTPCYINLYPNWAWQEEQYADHIEQFASMVDVPFFSFDQYPVTEKDGRIVIRPGWYRNLEEFSAMARRHGKPFWAFALTESHHLGAPSPEAFYPVPTLGHLRLQVFSDLLYGAQAIQYYNFRGIYEKGTLARTPVFDIVRQVNAEIKSCSGIFAGCEVKGVWHTGEVIPAFTKRLETAAIPQLKSLGMSGEGAVVSYLVNDGSEYLAVQNRDCENNATLDLRFSGRVSVVYGDSSAKKIRQGSFSVSPGNVIIFKLN